MLRPLVMMTVFGLAGSMVWGCGGDDASTSLSPVELCKQEASALCDKVFKCYTKDELDAAKTLVGLNSADCAVKFQADCTPEKSNCNAGETYHEDKAQACLAAYKTFTCDDVKGAFAGTTPAPAACDQSCTK